MAAAGGVGVELLWLLSGHSIVVSILNDMLGFVTLTFAVHLGSLQLAGASIACIGIQGLAYGVMVLSSKTIRISESIAKQGQIFARGLIPQLYALAISCPMQRFLQAQNIFNLLAYMSLVVFLLQVLLSWLVVSVWDYGLIGAALTLSLSRWLLVILNGFYIDFSDNYKETWRGFSVRAFRGIWPYFKLTTSFVVML